MFTHTHTHTRRCRGRATCQNDTLFHFSACTFRINTRLFPHWSGRGGTGRESCFHDDRPEMDSWPVGHVCVTTVASLKLMDVTLNLNQSDGAQVCRAFTPLLISFCNESHFGGETFLQFLVMTDNWDQEIRQHLSYM